MGMERSVALISLKTGAFDMPASIWYIPLPKRRLWSLVMFAAEPQELDIWVCQHWHMHLLYVDSVKLMLHRDHQSM